MPTYVYACRECDDRTEVVQKMSDNPLTECGRCGGNLRRVLFPPAVVYKGSGFYTTDYKNGGRKADGGTGSGDSAKADGKAADNKAADSKPAESKPIEPAVAN